MSELLNDYQSQLNKAKEDPVLKDILSRFKFNWDTIQFDEITLTERIRGQEKGRDYEVKKELLQTLLQIYIVKGIHRMRLTSLDTNVQMFWATETKGIWWIKHQLLRVIWDVWGLEAVWPINNTVLMSHDLLAELFEWAKWKSWDEFESITTRMSQNLANFMNQVMEKIFNPNAKVLTAKR